MANQLHQAMSRSPALKVRTASGRIDLATPYFAAEHSVSHLGLPQGLTERIRLTYYPAGHMMYVHEPSLWALKADLAAFYGWALGSGGQAG